jgi:large subunit ribosomal protein L24
VVLAGKDKGKRGKVLFVIPDRSRVLVEGINKVKRHTRPTRRDRQGGIIEMEAPIHISNLMVICPNCNKPARTKRQFLEERDSKSKVRVCKKCKEIIDKK